MAIARRRSNSSRAEVALFGALTAYGIAARRLLPARARIPANLGAAAAGIVLARAVGISTDELGLSPSELRRGVRVGVSVAFPVAVAVASAIAWPRARAVLADPRITETSPRDAAFEVLVRVPLETALAEELMYRGALLGIALDLRPPTRAVALSSLAFGLWHLPSKLESVEVATGAVIAATTVAGVGFAVLRMRTRSVAAPIIVHAALNMAAYSGVWLTARSST